MSRFGQRPCPNGKQGFLGLFPERCYGESVFRPSVGAGGVPGSIGWRCPRCGYEEIETGFYWQQVGWLHNAGAGFLVSAWRAGKIAPNVFGCKECGYDVVGKCSCGQPDGACEYCARCLACGGWRVPE